MTTQGLAALALAAALALGASAADEPKLPDAKAFDKLVIDTLRVVHNKGADLYNEGRDFAGAYRVYQGALITVRPLLAHRPDAQKVIDAGLEGAEKEADGARKAFVLHETIEGLRKNLKAPAPGPKPVTPEPKPKTKTPEPKPTEPPAKKPEPPAKKPDEPRPVDPPAKKPDEPKKPAPPVAPAPKEVRPK